MASLSVGLSGYVLHSVSSLADTISWVKSGITAEGARAGNLETVEELQGPKVTEMRDDSWEAIEFVHNTIVEDEVEDHQETVPLLLNTPTGFLAQASQKAPTNAPRQAEAQRSPRSENGEWTSSGTLALDNVSQCCTAFTRLSIRCSWNTRK